jgi:hypothetical protein
LDWIKAIANWIRKIAGQPTEVRPEFLKRWRWHGNVLTLVAGEGSADIPPGLVSLYELCPAEGSFGVIILLANIAQSREGVRRQKLAEEGWKRQFEIKARATISQQEKEILGTHLLLVGTISKVEDRARWVNGELVKFKHTDFLAAHILNLQSETAVLISGQNGYAFRIVDQIAKQLLRLTPSTLNSWDELIFAWPWLTWVEYYAIKNKYTRFPEKDHVIQPPRSRKAMPKRRHGHG